MSGHVSASSVCFMVCLCQVGYRFVGVSGSAGGALPSSLAPPATSESSPLDKPRHSWSPETVDANKRQITNELNTEII